MPFGRPLIGGELDEYLTWKSRPGARLLTEKRKELPPRHAAGERETEMVKEKWMKEEKSLRPVI